MRKAIKKYVSREAIQFYAVQENLLQDFPMDWNSKLLSGDRFKNCAKLRRDVE